MSATAKPTKTVGETCADDEVMAQVQADNGDALAILHRRYGGMIQRVATGILRDAAEAEDVTQEVFLEIYRKAYLFDPSRGSVRMWLLQYAYHRSLRRKAYLRLRAAYHGEPLEHAEAEPLWAGRALTPEESRWFIDEGLARLPERQRTTLMLACLEGASLKDVAGRLSVSVGCARHYYYRGLARLREWAASFDGIPRGAQAHAAMHRATRSRKRARGAGEADAATLRETLRHVPDGDRIAPAPRQSAPA